MTKAERYQRDFVGPIDGYDHAEAIRGMPCCVSGVAPPSEPHHVRSRGAGGTWSDMVPLSLVAHRAVHSMGRHTFEKTMGVDLELIAATLANEALVRGVTFSTDN